MPEARILNVVPSSNVSDDWTFIDAASHLELRHHDLLSSASDAVDLRAPWWDIGDQSDTGSCVGWAIADSLLRWHFVKEGRISNSDHLSPRFIWMAAKESDSQQSVPTTFIEKALTSIKAGLDVARAFGAVQEEHLPFKSSKMYAGTVDSFYELAARLKMKAYYNLGCDFNQIRAWLSTRGPVLFRSVVDENWLHATSTSARLDEFGAAMFGHAAVIVGYTPGTFIARNSWGVEWGDEGFAYLGMQYAHEALQETYGVVV